MDKPLGDRPSVGIAREAEPPPRDPAGPDVASAARVYDYLLGGGQNFAVDRWLAEQFLELEPDTRLIARHNRAFLGRAVRFLAGQGIRQFIDLGAGPTAGNVHEIAQKIAPDASVVYVDNDPVAVALGRRLLADNPHTTVIEADLRHTDTILAHPDLQALVGVRQPVAVLAVAVLHFLLDDPHAVVGLYRDAVAPGSYLVISHLTREHRAQEMAGISRLGTQAGTPSTPRTRTQIEVLFDGWDLVAPGLTWTAAWRAEREDLADIGDPARSNLLAGVAIKTHSTAARTTERLGMTEPPATGQQEPHHPASPPTTATVG
ncbi:MAG TPA: SAM-dependent methyltransferase, partial [Pseudonocardiaceae bacterium]|nr:SAM-dependent methyltransferase [Pseudonocardiaceae bacterium]